MSESGRQIELSALREEFDDLEGRFGLGSFGRHEVIDRSYIMTEMWELIRSHPSTVMDPKLYDLAEQIATKISDFYQAAACDDVWPDDDKAPCETESPGKGKSDAIKRYCEEHGIPYVDLGPLPPAVTEALGVPEPPAEDTQLDLGRCVEQAWKDSFQFEFDDEEDE